MMHDARGLVITTHTTVVHSTYALAKTLRDLLDKNNQN